MSNSDLNNEIAQIIKAHLATVTFPYSSVSAIPDELIERLNVAREARQNLSNDFYKEKKLHQIEAYEAVTRDLYPEYFNWLKQQQPPEQPQPPEPNIEPDTITVQLYRMAFLGGQHIGYYGRWENGPEFEIIIKEFQTDKYTMFIYEEGHRLKYSYWGDIDDIERAAAFFNIELDFMNTDMLVNYKSKYDAERIAALGEL